MTADTGNIIFWSVNTQYSWRFSSLFGENFKSAQKSSFAPVKPELHFYLKPKQFSESCLCFYVLFYWV